jgi:hypothetical protein
MITLFTKGIYQINTFEIRYGRSELMVATANMTVNAMRWLHTQEFSEFEKCCSGTDAWPQWHWPVLLLYGGHIALNQVKILLF